MKKAILTILAALLGLLFVVSVGYSDLDTTRKGYWVVLDDQGQQVSQHSEQDKALASAANWAIDNPGKQAEVIAPRWVTVYTPTDPAPSLGGIEITEASGYVIIKNADLALAHPPVVEVLEGTLLVDGSGKYDYYPGTAERPVSFIQIGSYDHPQIVLKIDKPTELRVCTLPEDIDNPDRDGYDVTVTPSGWDYRETP